MGETRVWLEGWEWERCGEPFAVGSEVEWDLVPMTVEGVSWLGEPLSMDTASGITHA
jgi:hypothetical protein